MRADRLLSLLMILQARGRVTAAQLARELEVSERTIYRDIDALSASGVPVYGDRGPEGGYALLGSYRTDLTGLTEGELRALFLLSIPRALVELGFDEEMAQALRKLSAALPRSRRNEEVRVRGRFYLDPDDWREPLGGSSHLNALRTAVWEDRHVDITYSLPSGPPVEQRIAPLGLVAKAGAWHVMFRHDERTQARPVADLIDARVTGERFLRPADFDLQEEWDVWCADAQTRPRYWMTLKVAEGFASQLARYGIEPETQEKVAPGPDGRIDARASCESFDDARARVLALGRAVEVIEPEPLRRSVIDYAEQTLARYSEEASA